MSSADVGPSPYRRRPLASWAVLVVCNALILFWSVLWVRSYFVNDAFGWGYSNGGRVDFWLVYVYSSRGGVAIGVPAGSIGTTSQPQQFGWNVERGEGRQRGVSIGGKVPRLARLGFGAWIERYTTRPLAYIALPNAAIVAVLAIPNIVAIRRYRRHRPTDADSRPCPNCGYDLRATPGRCPECGYLTAGAP